MTSVERIGRYEVVARMGAGGFATVYRARDPNLDSEVAIKVLADNWTANVEFKERFLREAQLLRRIDSDRVITVHDIGELPTGQPYFVMALADGGTLEHRLTERPPVTPADVLAVGERLADCINAVHSHDLIHRDIKPGNLMIAARRGHREGVTAALIGPNERLVLGDFGLAKDVALSGLGLTITAGTGGYAAPEQMIPTGSPDRRTDLYGATAVMYRVITGTVPPGFDTAQRRVPLPEDSALMRGPLGPFFRRGMAYDQSARHGSIQEWRRELETAVDAASPALTGSSPKAGATTVSRTPLPRPHTGSSGPASPVGPSPAPTHRRPPSPYGDAPRSSPTPRPHPGPVPVPGPVDGSGPVPVPGSRRGPGPVPVDGSVLASMPGSTGWPAPVPVPGPGSVEAPDPVPVPGSTGGPDPGPDSFGSIHPAPGRNGPADQPAGSGSGVDRAGAFPRRIGLLVGLGVLLVLMVGLAGWRLSGGPDGSGPTVDGPEEVVAGTTAEYTAAYDGATGYRWTNFDGTVTEGPTFRVTGVLPGTVNFSVSALVDGTETEATERTVAVVAADIAPSVSGPDEVTVGERVEYVATLPEGWTNPRWLLSSGDMLSGDRQVLTPQEPGPYVLAIVATSPEGVDVGTKRTVRFVVVDG
ncbi:MAG: protein kinase domain-containing protein [Acidimicrobiales bacterium]